MKKETSSPRIRELEQKLLGKLQEILGPSAGYETYANTTCGDKVISGPHVTVSWPRRPYDKSVPPDVPPKVFELFQSLYGDFLPEYTKPKRMNYCMTWGECWDLTFYLKEGAVEKKVRKPRKPKPAAAGLED